MKKAIERKLELAQREALHQKRVLAAAQHEVHFLLQKKTPPPLPLAPELRKVKNQLKRYQFTLKRRAEVITHAASAQQQASVAL